MADSLIKQLRMEAAQKALAEDEAENAAIRRSADVGLREQSARKADKDIESLELAADPFEAMRTYKRIQPYKAGWGEKGTGKQAGQRQTEEEYRKMVEDAPFPDEASRRAYEAAIQQAPEIKDRADWKRLFRDQILRGDR